MTELFTTYAKDSIPAMLTEDLYRGTCKKLKELRLETSSPQTFAANHVYGMHQSILSLIEGGRSFPPLKMVLACYYAFAKDIELATLLDDDYILYSYYQKQRGIEEMLYTIYPSAQAFKEGILRVAKEYPNYAFDIKTLIVIDEALKSSDEQEIKKGFEEVSGEMSIVKHYTEIKNDVSYEEKPRGRKSKKPEVEIIPQPIKEEQDIPSPAVGMDAEKKLTEQDINEIIAGLRELQKGKPKIETQPSTVANIYKEELDQYKQRFNEIQYLMEDTFKGLLLNLEELAEKSSPININTMDFSNNEQLRDWFIHQLPKASYEELLALFMYWQKTH